MIAKKIAFLKNYTIFKGLNENRIYNIFEKMKKLDNDLEKAKAKLSVATEKLQKANSKRDVAECIDKSGNKSDVPKEDQEGTGGREEGIGQCKEGVNTLCIQPGYMSLLLISKHLLITRCAIGHCQCTTIDHKLE
jgi:hypothetical protein